MKALSIVALAFAAVAIFVPVVGIFIALVCSVLALISFRQQPLFAGIAFGINILNTAFMTPSILIADVVSSSEMNATTDSGDVYWFYVGTHIVFLLAALVYKFIRKKSASNIEVRSV
jgi:hypothetical protein